uniref:Uncharacterized protein n=1 Tax=Anopheles atroparvus TaxID=41427 RepID=A0AAG5CNA0_ANOAO
MVREKTAPPRTDCRSRLQAPRIIPEAVRFRRPAPKLKVTKMVTWGALLMALVSSMAAPSGGVALGTLSTVEQLKPTVGSDGLTVSQDADAPTNEATISLEPQALSLTTQLAEDPTAASLDDRHDASLQLLPESSLAPSLGVEITDGRRRRRLGRKRKRRPLQDEYWPPEGKPDDNDPESNGGGGGGGGGRLSERKRLPYAGAAASRWEGINKLPTAHGRLARPEHQQQQLQQQPFRSGHHRANDWMNNPYTDAISFEQQTGATRRPYVAAASTAVGGNFSPIDPNRPRRISSNGGGRPTEPSAASAAANSNPKAYRKPYSQARRSEEQFSSSEGSAEATVSSAADLKALLKQSDGLSLSEILQQRNISLQDLIKGKQMALAALTQSPPVDVSTVTPGELTDTTTAVSPTLSSVRFRVYDDSSTLMTTTTATVTSEPSSSGPESTVDPRPMATVLTEDETNNSVDELDGHGVSIFPTVEIKQLALNPVLPVFKEESRLRPIKGVASRIRPDLSNTHIRTSEPARFPSVGVKRLQPTPSPPSSSTSSIDSGDENALPSSTTPPVPSNPTVPSLLLITSTAREKWTPSASLVGQRQRQTNVGNKLQQQQATASPVGSPSESPTGKELDRLSSAEATSMLPEAEAMVELAPERGHYQHHQLLRVPKLKTRIAIKPKLTNVVPPTSASTTTTTTATTTTTVNSLLTEGDRFNLSDVELGDDGALVNESVSGQSRRQQRLNNGDDDDEPELNIIEKFTSFAEPASTSLEGKTASDDGEMADLVGRISEHTQRSFTDSLEEFYRDVTESNPSLFNDLAPIASSDDRRELLELMEDRRIGARLAKVLSQRNMTLEQLLEHRRRGSSQLHLAEIVAGKVKPIDDKIDIVTAFEHFPRFNIGNLRSIRPDDIKQDSQGFSYFTSIINLRPADDGYKEGRARALASPPLPVHRHRGSATAGNHRNEAHFLASGGSKDRLLLPSRMSATGVYGSSSNYEDDARRENGAEEHDLLDLELSGHGFQHHRSASVTIESTSIPVGVRSAIVASSAIVGVSLAIFVAIFVTCRLRQRRRQKLNYTENFHMAKGRLPIIHSAELEARKSSSERSSGSAGEQVVYTTHRALGGGGASSSSTDAGTARGRQQQQQQQPQQSAMM